METKYKHIVLGSRLMLRKVSDPKPEELLIISKEDFTDTFSEELLTPENISAISEIIMKGVYNFSRFNLPHGTASQIKIEPSSTELKKILCTPLEQLLKKQLVELLKKLGVHYVYDLVYLTRNDYKKVRGLGIAKIFSIENMLLSHGITQEFIKKIKEPLAKAPSFGHEQMVKTIEDLVI